MNAELSPHYDFLERVLSESPIPELVPPDKGAPQVPRSNGRECRVIRTATARGNTFGITVSGKDTIGVIVCVDLERGAPEKNKREKLHGR